MFERGIEFQYQHSVKMLSLERSMPLRQRHQQRRRIRRPQKSQRVRVECDRDALRILPARPLDGAPQNFAMPKVHAVEYADSHNRPPAISAKSRSPFLGRMYYRERHQILDSSSSPS